VIDVPWLTKMRRTSAEPGDPTRRSSASWPSQDDARVEERTTTRPVSIT
jgi:hypothetical protein